jgi:hypothetical protein
LADTAGTIRWYRRYPCGYHASGKNASCGSRTLVCLRSRSQTLPIEGVAVGLSAVAAYSSLQKKQAAIILNLVRRRRRRQPFRHRQHRQDLVLG